MTAWHGKWAQWLSVAVVAGGVALAEGEPWKIPPAELKGVKNPVAKPALAASAARGAALYKQHCASCHGETGKGDGPDGAYYTPLPSDLTAQAVVRQPDAELFVKITRGRGDMERFDKKLDAAQRWDAVNFVRTLR